MKKSRCIVDFPVGESDKGKLLQRDLALNEFRPFYQPILELSSGRIAGYEALARHLTPEGGAESAGALFSDPAIGREEKRQLDRCLREQALHDHAQHSAGEFVSLNISPDWVDLLGDDCLVPTLEMVRALGVDPARIVVEITEHGGNLENLRRLTRAYHAAGLKVAIDDFGVGASQLDRIIELEPDFIKLDMGLFKAAFQGGSAANVALAIVSMAQRAGCKIICEGIETEAELHFAIECGAEFIQGWLFAPALPERVAADAFLSRINTMKQGYLLRKSQKQADSARHNHRIASVLGDICQSLAERDVLLQLIERLPAPDARDLGILRFFLCDDQGTQISANGIVGDEHYTLNHEYIGCNWSHRPYFPLLHAMRGFEGDHIVVSDPYLDITTGKMCKTYGLFVSADCVLLIDVRVDDIILFQSVF